MKKIFILLLAFIGLTCFTSIQSKAASRESLVSYTLVSEGSLIEPGYYALHILDQDESLPNFGQATNALRNLGQCNQDEFKKDNVKDILEEEFNLTCTDEIVSFLSEIKQVKDDRWTFVVLIKVSEPHAYDDIIDVLGEVFDDIYLFTTEKAPDIATSEEKHMINYDSNITLDQIKATYSATDNYDKDLTSKLQFESDYPENPKEAKINTEYYIRVWVEDSSGNKAEVINYIYVFDLTAPKFSKEALSYNLSYGEDFSFNNIVKDLECTDNYEGKIDSSKWQKSRDIDLEFLGTQKVEISYTDGSGNMGKCEVTISIVDNISPVITVMPIEISTSNPLSEEAILNVLESSGQIDSGYTSYELVTEYFNHQDQVGQHDATLILHYDNDEEKTYRFKINVMESITNTDKTNNYWYLYVIGAIVVVALVGTGVYIYCKKKRKENI